jgi:hypothetical protein
MLLSILDIVLLTLDVIYLYFVLLVLGMETMELILELPFPVIHNLLLDFILWYPLLDLSKPLTVL